MTDNLKLITLSNIGYTTLARLFLVLLQVSANIILSRLLCSSDYGIVGFAVLFVNFLIQFDDLGINSALIQRKEISEDVLHTAFTMKAALGLILSLITVLVAPMAGSLFDDPAVVDVIRLLSLNFLIKVLAFLPIVLLSRELNYKKLSLINSWSNLAQYSFVVILAFYGYRYWSIVIGSLISSIVIMLLANISRPQKVKLHIDKHIATEIIHYGWKVFATGFLIFIVMNADNFIIGSAGGASSLGYYVIAFTWGSQVCIVIKSVVHNVLFPTFSKIQDNIDLLRLSYLKVLRYVSFGGAFVNMILFVIAKDFLVLVLGHGSDKWLPAFYALRIFCVYGIVRLILEPIGNVIMALGKPQVLLKANLIAALLEVGLAYPALYYFGIEGVAIIVLISYLVQYGIYVPFIITELSISVSQLIRVIAPTIVTILPLLALSFFLDRFWNAISYDLLMAKAIISILIYLSIYGIFTRWTIFVEVKNLINEIKMNNLKPVEK